MPRKSDPDESLHRFSNAQTEMFVGAPRAAAGEGEAPKTIISTPPSVGDVVPAPLEHAGFGERYELRASLGEGGMGVVLLYQDRHIGRDVAMKVIRAEHLARGELHDRFLLEARVQGQLEHPSIVPVYDLGRDPAGAIYFTMKRIRGRTLEEVLDGLRDGDREIEGQYSRRKLLTAFGSVCLAVHFAHTRGVLHRDLKPGNVMLGDFGEVHVLDWGLAKLVGAGDAGVPPLPPSESGATTTAYGVIMGTPGYMPPEQVRGQSEALDARADVYALGSILFELLTLQPLHGGGGATEVIASTLRGAEARPSRRAPDREVPPELEAICVKATALGREDRYPSARELDAAVERYLDGDRDLERRRELADMHAGNAERAVAEALAADGPAVEERARAMREVGRAVALDPAHPGAMRTLVRLLTEPPPRQLPDEVRETIIAHDRASMRTGSWSLALAYLIALGYVPLGLWMGVRSPLDSCLSIGAWLCAALAALSLRRPPASGKLPLTVIVASMLGVASAATIFSPFFLVPTLAAVNTMSFMINNRHPSRRVAALVVGSLGFLIPVALEWTGVLPPSLAFRDGMLLLLPRMLEFPAKPTLVFLLIGNLALIVTPALAFVRLRRSLDAAEERIHFHTWQLAQMVPREARDAIEPEPATAAACKPG